MIRAQRLIERVSEDNQGANQAEGLSDSPALNADGGFAAFLSEAPGLVPGDQNGLSDAFVRNRTLGQTERISVGFDGSESNGASELGGFSPGISGDGRFVCFSSVASNLVSDDTNGLGDVFVYDRSEQVTERVSMGIDGASGLAAISQDGRHVVFESLASNLVGDDTNEVIDIFLFDRETRTTRRAASHPMAARPTIIALARQSAAMAAW